MHIDFINEIESFDMGHVTLVEEILQFAANFLKLSTQIECSVSFVTNDAIQAINREFRGKDVPTDVISFALDDHEDDIIVPTTTPLEGFYHNIGDIIISIERAEEQAAEYGHSFERELGFLALHGFLHLNGYDHLTEEDEKEMFSLQDTILKEFGLNRE